MSRLKIMTESGSEYRVDTVARELRRIPGEKASSLQYDGGKFKFDRFVTEPEVGARMAMFWGGGLRIRYTTTVVSIEDLD